MGQNVYITEVPTVADVKVYVTSTPTIADVIVYKAPSAIYPGIDENKGIWRFVDIQTIANKTIFYTDVPTIADLKVYFTNDPMRAGWIDDSKKKLME